MTSSPKLSAEDVVLQTFPEFESVEYIGEGAHGRVYKVKQDSQHFALKIYKNKISNQQLKFFKKEVAAMACLRHPNIIEIYDWGEKNEYPFILAEFVDGERLDKVLTKGLLSVEIMIKVFINIASAIVASRRSGVIYYNIKPRDIIIAPTNDFLVKIIDQGFILNLCDMAVSDYKACAEVSSHSSEDERSKIMQDAFNEPIDLHSIRLIICECLTRSAGIQQNRILENLASQLQKNEPQLSAQKNEFIQQIVKKLINDNPEDRYYSTEQLLADLQCCDALTDSGNAAMAHRMQSARIRSIYPRKKIIGRMAELEKIRSIKSQSLEKIGQVAVVVGQNGSGKSSLIQQVVYEGNNHQRIILSGKFCENEINPISAITKAWEHYLESLEESSELQKTESDLVQSLGPFPWVVSCLFKKFNTIINKSEDPLRDMEISEDQFACAAADFFLTFFEKRDCPVILLFEDLHWAPSQSLLIFEKISARIQSKNVLILFTADSENANTQAFISKLQSSATCPVLTLELEPMNDFEIVDIARRQMGDREITDDLVHKIIEVSKGHPYTSEQFARFLIDSGKLKIRNGSWNVDLNLAPSNEWPHSLDELLHQRMLTLSHLAYSVLQVGALVGHEFRKSLIVKVLNVHGSRLMSAVQELVRGDFVCWQDQESIKFCHEQVLKVIKQRMRKEEIKFGHAQIAKAMLSFSDFDIFEVAEHFFSAKSVCHYNAEHNVDCMPEEEQALSVYEKAGLEAYHKNNNELAEKFLSACIKSPVFHLLNDKSKVNILFSLAHVCRRLGQYEKASDLFQKAIILCDDPHYRSRIRVNSIQIGIVNNFDIRIAESELSKCYEDVGEVYFASNVRFYNLRFIFEVFRSLFKIALFFIYQKNNAISEQQKYRLKSLSILDQVVLNSFYYSVGLGNMVLTHLRSYQTAIRLGDSKESLFTYSFYLLFFGLIKKKNWLSRLSKYLRKIALEKKDLSLFSTVETNTVAAYLIAGDPIQASDYFNAVIGESANWIFAEDFFKMNHALAISFALRGRYDQLARLLELPMLRAERNNSEFKTIILNGFNVICLFAKNRSPEAEQRLLGLLKSIKSKPQQFACPVEEAASIFAVLWGCFENKCYIEHAEEIIETYVSCTQKFRNILILRGPLYLLLCYVRLDRYLKTHSESNRKLFLESFTELNKAAIQPDVQVHRLIIEASYLSFEELYDDAIDLLNQALIIAEKIKAVNCLVQIHCELARIYKQKVNLNLSKGHALMAADLARMQLWQKKVEWIANEFSLQSFRVQNSRFTDTDVADSVNNQKYTDSLMKVSLAMSATLDPVQQARIALDQMIQLLHAERAFLFSYEKDKEMLIVKSGRNDKGQDLSHLEGFSNTIISKVFKERKPVILVADETGECLQAESIVAKGLKSIMAVPLFFKEQFVGAAYFDSQLAKGLFSQEDFEICKGICSHISIAQEVASSARIHAEKAAYEKDLALTATVQSLFFPENAKYQERNISLNGVYKASALCSGDWWWYAKSSQGKLRVFALDVTGHGAPSAMVTAILATLIRHDIREGVFQSSSIPDFLKKINQKLFSMIEGKYCTTLTVFELDQQTGYIDMWSAASPPLVVLSQDGSKHIVEAPGELIGYENKDLEFGHATHQMKDGDRLHVFSDGLLELPVKSGMNYSIRKLIQIFNKNMKSQSGEAMQSILNEVEGYVGDTSKVDDITLILVDYKAS